METPVAEKGKSRHNHNKRRIMEKKKLRLKKEVISKLNDYEMYQVKGGTTIMTVCCFTLTTAGTVLCPTHTQRNTCYDSCELCYV